MDMEMESCVPPGFRFHPTEEELVGYYLNRKVNSLKIDLDVIVDIDLYRMEPWDIQDRCKLGYEEQNEWYFFSHKDRKYPTGTRTNRATAAGFWKATGRDKAVISKENVIGMRKTLVFYKGRAPNGRKTDWIMHEYRLQTSDQAPPQEEGWVVCRAFKKPCPSHKQGGFEAWSNASNFYKENENYRRSPSFVHHHHNSSITTNSSSSSMHAMINPLISTTHDVNSFQLQVIPYAADDHQEILVSNYHPANFNNQLVELPRLDSPSMSSTTLATNDPGFDKYTLTNEDGDLQHQQQQQNDWKFLDKRLVAHLNDPSADLYALPNHHHHNVLIPRDDEFLLGYFTDL